MKTKILSLVVVLSVILSLGIAVPASAASTGGARATAVSESYVTPPPGPTGPFDVAWVATWGDDGWLGTPSHPWRTLHHAVDMLPYNNGPGDPKQAPYNVGIPNNLHPLYYDGSVPSGINCDLINVDPGMYGDYAPNNSENVVIMHPVYIQTFNWGDKDTYNKDGVGTKIVFDPNNRLASAMITVYEGQDPASDNVITILSGGVTLDGLYLVSESAAHRGVSANATDTENPLCDVKVINCGIKLDTCDGATGIWMEQVKYACLYGNYIWINTGGNDAFVNLDGVHNLEATPAGVLMFGCFDACVVLNTINVYGNEQAVGVGMYDCDSSKVDHWPQPPVCANIIHVNAGCDSTGVGIEVFDSDLLKVVNNTVIVKVCGVDCALGFGIKVAGFNVGNTGENVTIGNKIDGNTVDVSLKSTSSTFGLMFGTGIWLINGQGGEIGHNSVNVCGIGTFNSNGLPFELPSCHGLDVEMAGINQIITFINAHPGDISGTLGLGGVVGIAVTGGEMNVVCDNNPVNVRLAADFIAGSSLPITGAAGAAIALGIIGCDSDCLAIKDNTVTVDKPDNKVYMANVEVFEQVGLVTTPPADAGYGFGLAVALGIGLYDCDDSLVDCNNVTANSSMYILVFSWVYDASAASTGDTLLDQISSPLFSSIVQSYYDAVESDSVNAQWIGYPTCPVAYAFNGGLVAGIAVLAIDSDALCVTGNTAIGHANLVGDAEAFSDNETYDAIGTAGGVSLGGGIGLYDCGSFKVDGNTTVSGTGLANVRVGVGHEDVDATDAHGCGGGAGLGFGILVIGSCEPDFNDEVGAGTIPPTFDGKGPEVIGNHSVTALGKSDNVTVVVCDEYNGHVATANGFGLGLAIGIGSLWNKGITIKDNYVNAEGYALLCVDSCGKATFDPESEGWAAGVGVGIADVGSRFSKIIGNTSFGKGTAKGFIASVEFRLKPKTADSVAGGGTLGLGSGILVFDSACSTVQGNSYKDAQGNCLPGAVGVGDAQTRILSVSWVPLNSANLTFALSAGIGNGIAVICSPKTDVVDCNMAAGAGTAKLCTWAWADFVDYDGYLSVGASIDILMALHPYTQEITASDFDAVAEHWCYQFGDVNYNSMVDVAPVGTNGCCTDKFDAGLLKIGCPGLNAEFNWWNDPTGPSGFGPGIVREFPAGSHQFVPEALYWCGRDVSFDPWLYVDHCITLTDQTGYFGFYFDIYKGVNAISTPIQLSNGTGATLFDANGNPRLDGSGNPIRRVVPASRTWGQIKTNSGITAGDIKYQIKWVGDHWEWMIDNDPLGFVPLDAYYVYFKNDCKHLIMYVDGDGQSMPQKTLNAGWNLIGPNPLFPLCGMDASSVLVSVDQMPNGNPGWVQAISPQVKNQDAWVFTPNMKCDVPFMKSGHGYWVYMLNDGAILVGYGFTPLPDKLREID